MRRKSILDIFFYAFSPRVYEIQRIFRLDNTPVLKTKYEEGPRKSTRVFIRRMLYDTLSASHLQCHRCTAGRRPRHVMRRIVLHASKRILAEGERKSDF